MMEDNKEVQPTFTIDGIEIGLIKLDPVAVKKAADGLLELNQAAVCIGIALSNCLYSRDLIPEVAKLTETTPMPYDDVLAICEAYGEGYKELIQKHIEAGTTYQALDEMRDELRDNPHRFDLTYVADELNKINELTSRLEKKTGNKYCKFELSNGRIRAFGLKEVNEPEKKLPKRFRRGW